MGFEIKFLPSFYYGSNRRTESTFLGAIESDRINNGWVQLNWTKQRLHLTGHELKQLQWSAETFQKLDLVWSIWPCMVCFILCYCTRLVIAFRNFVVVIVNAYITFLNHTQIPFCTIENQFLKYLTHFKSACSQRVPPTS